MPDDPKSIARRPQFPASTSRPMVTPLYPSVAYASPDATALDDQYEGRAQGYTYAREGHPNADVLVQKINSLEGAHAGIITGSGMAAIGAVYLALLKTGDHVIAGDQLYGRNLRLLTEDLPRQGITVSFCDVIDADQVSAAMTPATRLVVIETIANPTLRLADVPRIAAITRAAGITLMVDNTFSTPAMIRPLDLGADIVMHSVTKLLAGHSDATLGYLGTHDAKMMAAITTACVTWGLTPSPFDCWLAERGLQSFDLRFERAQSNAKALADTIADLPGVTQVLYPSRADHPDRTLAQSLYRHGGGTMLSFALDGDRDTVDRFLRAASDILFAPTLGDISTTISHPATSSHRALSQSARLELGIPEAFFRISVGVEHIELLRQEFTTAIAKAMA